MISSVEVVSGSYYDSVRLMQVSRLISDMAGVERCLVAMSTDLNLHLLSEMGFDPLEADYAGPDDLIVAIGARDQSTLDAARAAVDQVLAAPSNLTSAGLFVAPPARTVGTGAGAIGANVALVSVPGPHAFVEAMAALEAGIHVMIFSDNVALEHELLLKEVAAERQLLVMGPDCGTAIVHGLGLGFANVVQPGPVAITGASGTGIQQLCCLLDSSGVGVRHALGTGSRDLSREVGASSTIRALGALDADPEVQVIVVVAKPPDSEAAAALERAVEGCSTPVVPAMLGSPDVTLERTARQTVDLLGVPWVAPPVWRPESFETRQGHLRGLFSGGTLRAEAHVIASTTLSDLATEPDAPGHWLCDFGADRYTRGRAHPMIDPSLRLEALDEVIGDPTTGTVLIDVVLGHGAHPDPARDLAPLVSRASQRGIATVTSLCGTRGDPQGRDEQAERLQAAGAEVYLCNAEAAARAARLTTEVHR
jgi:FdrA protein